MSCCKGLHQAIESSCQGKRFAISDEKLLQCIVQLNELFNEEKITIKFSLLLLSDHAISILLFYIVSLIHSWVLERTS